MTANVSESKLHTREIEGNRKRGSQRRSEERGRVRKRKREEREFVMVCLKQQIKAVIKR